MAVANTTTFSLQDVVDEINPTTNDLLDCVSDATFGSYDGSYFSSPATSLLEFRNYGASSVVLTLSAVGDNFVVANASVAQSIQLQFEYVSQTFTGNASTVTAGGVAQSIGAIKTVNTTGGPGSIWNVSAFLNPFNVGFPGNGVATVTIGLTITAAGVDSFPTSQLTITKNFFPQ